MISWTVVGLLVIPTAIAAFFLITNADTADFKADAKLVGVTSALGIVFVFLLVLTLLGGQAGMFGAIIGKDSRYSTSKASVAVWTLFVAVTLPYLLMKALALYGSNGEKIAKLFEGTWEQYAILIGGPAAAAVLAKGITTWKIDGGQLQKPPASDPHVEDLGTSDDGSASMADTQYLLFNLIALLYASAAFIADGVWVDIPAPLLGLTSVSASLYVGTKAATRNAPAITAVVPNAGAVSTEVTVTGQNFKPAGANGTPAVLIGSSTERLLATAHTDTSIAFTVPPSVVPGATTISVISAANVATAPTLFTVIATTPTITGTVDGQPVQIGSVTLTGNNLRPPPGGALIAKVNGFVVPSHANEDGTAVVLTIPPTTTLAATGADVELVVNGITSGAAKLPTQTA